MELDELFKFPIIMIDRKQEEKDEMLSLPKNNDTSFVIGEGEEPWYEFSGSIRDYWIPGDDESYARAKEGDFDSCFVRFKSSDYIIPWNKEKFKRLWKKFKDDISEKTNPKESTRIIFLPDSKFDLVMEAIKDEVEIEEDGKEESDGD